MREPTEQEITMKFSKAIKRAMMAARALVHHQQNFQFKVIADCLELVHKMIISRAAAEAATQEMKVQQALKALGKVE
jgi:diacylglycerol kinase